MFAFGGSFTRLAGALPALNRTGSVAAGAVLTFGSLAVGLVAAGSAHAASAAPHYKAAPASCTEPVRVTFTGHSVSGSSVTIRYSITGCKGTATIHIHENLLTGRNAGKDNVNQVNYDVQVSKNSPTSHTVPLLAGVAGKCFVQVDYSSATERHGFFTAAPTCASISPTSVTPSPPSSAPPSAQVLPESTSVPILPAAAPTDLKPAHSDTGIVALVVAGISAALAIPLGLRRVRRRS